jgi:probable rRNA maturation factor
MNYYEIINETKDNIDEIKKLNLVIDFTLKHEKVENAVFNIIFVDNNKIQEINKEYRNKDEKTDVISFALEDNKDIKLDIRILGDIYISIEKAKEQAKDYGHSLEREISFLTIHGLLHLLGYDHTNKEEEQKMFELQERILEQYGIKR